MINKKYLKIVGINSLLLALFGISQVIFEMRLAAVTNTSDFETYILLRNIYLLFTPLVSFGLGELFVRIESNKEFSGSRIFLFNLLLILFSVFLFYFFPFKKFFNIIPINKFILSLGLLFFSLFQVLASFFRGKKNFTLAIIFRDGWRVIIWISFLSISLVEKSFSENIVLVLIFCQGLILSILVLNYSKLKIKLIDKGILKNSIGLSFSFWLSLISLSLATYLDQIYLKSISINLGELKFYSLAITIIVQPFVLLSTAVGGILMPLISSGKRIKPLLKSYLVLIKENKIFSFLLLILIIFVLFYIARLLLSLVNLDLNFTMFAILICIGLMRLFYTVISTAIGAISDSNTITIFTSLGFVAIIIQILFAYLSYLYLGIYSIAIGTLLLWLIRNLAGTYFIRKMEF